MAAFHGKQGKVTFAGVAVSNVTSWTIEASCDVADATAMSSVVWAAATHWKEYIAGYKDWTATVECIADDGGFDPDLDTDFAQDEDGIALVLYSGMIAADQQEGARARMYSGNAIITGITVSTDLNDVAKITYAVQGSGVLTEAASTAT